MERIIKVRKQGSRREYFVEWTGWEAEYNSWTKDMSRDLIDEYQGEQVALAKLRERPPKYPKTPFTRDRPPYGAPRHQPFSRRVARLVVLAGAT